MFEKWSFFDNRIHDDVFIGRDIENILMYRERDRRTDVVRRFVISMYFLNEGFEKFRRFCLIKTHDFGVLFLSDLSIVL